MENNQTRKKTPKEIKKKKLKFTNKSTMKLEHEKIKEIELNIIYRINGEKRKKCYKIESSNCWQFLQIKCPQNKNRNNIQNCLVMTRARQQT